MNIFIFLHQYSEPTFLTALKSTKIERRGTRSAFDRMRHDLRFLITTFYVFAIHVSIREGVKIYRRNHNDDSFLSCLPSIRELVFSLTTLHTFAKKTAHSEHVQTH